MISQQNLGVPHDCHSCYTYPLEALVYLAETARSANWESQQTYGKRCENAPLCSALLQHGKKRLSRARKAQQGRSTPAMEAGLYFGGVEIRFHRSRQGA